jgi:hypothetical protein
MMKNLIYIFFSYSEQIWADDLLKRKKKRLISIEL